MNIFNEFCRFTLCVALTLGSASTCLADDSINPKVIETFIHNNSKSIPKSKVSALINMDEYMGDCQQEIYKAKVEGVQFSTNGKTLESFRFTWRGNQMVIPTNLYSTRTLSNAEKVQVRDFIRVGRTYLVHFQLCGSGGYPSLINIYEQSGLDMPSQVSVAHSRPQTSVEANQPIAEPTDPAILYYYLGLMNRKIRSNLNPTDCPASNPDVIINMSLAESGDFSSDPKIVKSSGDAKCDEAILKGLAQAKPFDMPDHPNDLRKLIEPIRLKLKPRG